MPANPKKTKNPSLRLQDPYLEREKLKYSNPLPSREHVLTILAQQGVPMAQDDLAQVLSISSEEIGFFTRRLSAMEREGQIIINRAGAVCVAKKLDLIKCRVSGHRDGFGFAIPEDGEGNDIFLSEREMHKVMHGDRVMVRATGTDRRGRIEGTKDEEGGSMTAGRGPWIGRESEAPAQTHEWGRIVWRASAALRPGSELTFGRSVIEPGRRNLRHFHPNCEELLSSCAGASSTAGTATRSRCRRATSPRSPRASSTMRATSEGFPRS